MSDPVFNGPAYTEAEYRNSWKIGKFHGASIGIELDGKIKHISGPSLYVTTPVVRSYRDGIRVGCTFISNEAIKHLHSLHQNFLQGQIELTHQEEE